MSESSEKTDNTKRGDKRGILRLDISKPRNSSGSVEFRNQPEVISETSSPQSTQCQSVKWAFAQDNNAENASDVQVRSSEKRAKKSLSADFFGYQPYYDQFYMEPIDVPDYINSEDEDYSISLSAVIQRRASVRGRKKGYSINTSPRRASSPMGHVSGVCGISASNSIVASKADRRRSSVYTTSSGETVVSLGDGATNQESTKEQIFENIRLHKEVLQSVKMQPWSMRRKLRLVRQAREYIARHEGALQERFATSRSTKDLYARFKIVLAVKWQHLRREMANLTTLFVPWQLRIKEIESHFGSVVASYFTFLRWLFWVNIVLAFTLSTFVILPEFIASFRPGQEDHRKKMLPDEIKNATKLTTFLNFQGHLKYSPLFYGYYSDYSGIAEYGYDLPMAYFFAGITVYVYSFWATLRKMADNSRLSKMSSKEDECVFSWKLFTGWDYMIGHAETAHNRVASVVLSFKEALLEEAEKKKDTKNWKIVFRRIFVNLVVLCLLVLSSIAVIRVVERSEHVNKETDGYWRQNETSFLMTGITFVFPTCFEILGLLEKYHPRKQLRWQLGRIMLLNLLNLFSLIIALFKKIEKINRDLEDVQNCTGPYSTKPPSANEITDLTQLHGLSFSNGTTTAAPIAEATAIYGILHAAVNDLFPNILPTVATIAATTFGKNVKHAKKCISVPVNCSKTSIKRTTATSILTSLMAVNFATTILPEITSQLNTMDYSSTTTSTYTDMDFVYNITIFDETIDNETELSENANGLYSMDGGRTTAFPFNDVMKYNYEATTPTSLYEDGDDGEEYTYEDGDSNDGIETDGQRHRRDIIKALSNSVSDEIENEQFVYSDLDTDYSNNDTFNDANMTDFIASTVSAFLESTITVDPYNETSMSEQWENYLSTISTTEMDSFDNTASTDSTFDTTIDDDDGNINNDECIDGYKIICYDDNGNVDKNGATATQMIANENPLDVRASGTVPTTSLWNALETTAVANKSILLHSTVSSNSALNNITVDECMPFEPNRSDTVTHIAPEYVGRNLTYTIERRSLKIQQKLRDYCWETLFGQEMVKLTVLDLVFTIFTTLCMDFFRALFVRFMNKCWCWDLEKKFPKYGDFKIAENILHLVNSQGQVWMGMFFAPGLAILNLFKLGILMYFRSWAVLTCNVPHEVVFRASRSNNFYLALLLTMLFLCVLPVSYAIIWIDTSWHCGPFSHKRISRVFTDTVRKQFEKRKNGKAWIRAFDVIASPSTVIPILLLLILIIYYLMSLTGALREANQDLRNQLRRERQEERRKMLQRVVNAKLDDSGGNNAIDRWRKVLEASSPVTPNVPGQTVDPDEEKLKARREFLTRIMKKALRKSSNTSEDESHMGVDDGDETDTEQHEQLPHDQDTTTTTDKRTPTKRKKSILHLVDDKIPEHPSQSHSEPQLKHHHHRHHHHKQLPRKLSFMQLREIAETSHQKSEQSNEDEIKPEIESISAHSVIVEPQAKEKCIRTEENAQNQEDEQYNKVNVVSERRALRRQQNARESESSLSLQMSLPDTANYGIVNEKPKPIEKPPRTKSPLKGNSPEIFKFDSKLPEIHAHGQKSNRENDESEAEIGTTLMSPVKNESPTIEMDSVVISQSKNPSPTASIQLHSPKEMEINVSSSASTPIKSSESRKHLSETSTPQQSPLPSEKGLKHGSGSDDILNKPIRKLNSFFALVKDAVHPNKKSDQSQTQPQQQQQQTQHQALPHQESSIDASPSHDLVSRVKLFIDDSNSVSMSESIKTTTESVTSSKLTCYESLRRLRHAEQTKPKRQDSQASIWSENIPVITISKSESNECILERCDNDDVELSDRKK